MWRQVTEAVVLVVLTALVIYDVYVGILNDEKRDTISEVIADAASWPVVPYGTGVLMGHWFIPGTGMGYPWGMMTAVGTILAALLLSRVVRTRRRYAIGWLSVGTLAGWGLWGMP